MAWEQILGFFTMGLHPEITVSLWAKAGVPIWQTFGYTIIWTSLTLSITYFGAGWIKNWIKKFIKEEILEKWQNWWQLKNNHFQKHLPEKKIIGWLIRQKNWLILGCGFVPFVYGLPAAVIATARILEIRHALIILYCGNVFRNGIICFLIYKLFS